MTFSHNLLTIVHLIIIVSNGHRKVERNVRFTKGFSKDITLLADKQLAIELCRRPPQGTTTLKCIIYRVTVNSSPLPFKGGVCAKSQLSHFWEFPF